MKGHHSPGYLQTSTSKACYSLVLTLLLLSGPERPQILSRQLHLPLLSLRIHLVISMIVSKELFLNFAYYSQASSNDCLLRTLTQGMHQHSLEIDDLYNYFWSTLQDQ